MADKGYFDTKRDNELIAAGTHFWCEGCLKARPLGEQSPDPRYCQGCCDFLLKEVEMMGGHSRKATWMPSEALQSKSGGVNAAPHKTPTPTTVRGICPPWRPPKTKRT